MAGATHQRRNHCARGLAQARHNDVDAEDKSIREERLRETLTALTLLPSPHDYEEKADEAIFKFDLLGSCKNSDTCTKREIFEKQALSKRTTSCLRLTHYRAIDYERNMRLV